MQHASKIRLKIQFPRCYQIRSSHTLNSKGLSSYSERICTKRAYSSRLLALPRCGSPISLYRRFASTDAKSDKPANDGPQTPKLEKVPDLKTMLRKFYLMVHPDLFTAHPVEREVNEDSFQKLQGYLDEFFDRIENSSSTFHGSSNASCSVKFYYRIKENKPSSASSSTSSSTTDPTPTTTGDTNSTSQTATVPKPKLDLSNILKTNPTSTSSKSNANEKKEEKEETKFGIAATTFPPFLTEASTLHHTKQIVKNLKKLFQECGLSTNFTIGNFFSANDTADTYRETLADFISDHADLARQRIANSNQLEHQLDFQTNCFYIQYRLKVSFELPIFHFSDEDLKRSYFGSGGNRNRNSRTPTILDEIKLKTKLLNQLQSALEGMHHSGENEKLDNLAGVTIVFEKWSGVDRSGRVCLHYCDDVEGWTKTLKSVDSDEIYRLKKIHKSREAKELEVSKKLGISHVYADYQEQNTEEYLSMLDQLLNRINSKLGTSTKNKQLFTSLHDLKLRITKRATTQQNSADHVDNFYVKGMIEIDREHGVLAVPFDIFKSPNTVLEQIESKGSEIVSQHRSWRHHSDDLDKLMFDVFRRLRLHRIYFTDVDLEQVGHCCGRLLKYQNQLGSIIWGLRINICNQNLLHNDGTLDIKWDFEM